MKIKYLVAVLATVSFAATSSAQSDLKQTASHKTSSESTLASIQLKSGPLADFYELVAQHQLSKPANILVAEKSIPKRTELPTEISVVLSTSSSTLQASKP